MSHRSHAQQLRHLIDQGRLIRMPCAYDGLSARVAQSVGFPAVAFSGNAVSASLLGLPDIGALTLTENVAHAGRIARNLDIPMVCDADTGYGGLMNVMRTVREFEAAGVAGIHIEDQVTPKRCGHLSDKALVSKAEMVGKLKAALDARQSAEMLIVARTDAIAVEGFDKALDRAEAYVAAGADMLFVEAPVNREQMAEITSRFAARVPLLANMVEGGKTPILPAAELRALGFRLVIFPGGTVRAVAFAMRNYFASLHEHGTTDPYRGRMLDFSGLNKLLGTEEFRARGRRYAEDAS